MELTQYVGSFFCTCGSFFLILWFGRGVVSWASLSSTPSLTMKMVMEAGPVSKQVLELQAKPVLAGPRRGPGHIATPHPVVYSPTCALSPHQGFLTSLYELR